MKIKSSLIAVVLAMMVLCAGNFNSTASAAGAKPKAAFAGFMPGPPSCSLNCMLNYQSCTASCNGDPICLADCKEERDCCLVICHGGEC